MTKLYKLSRISGDELLDMIDDYFYTIYLHREISFTETNNALHVLMEIFFRYINATTFNYVSIPDLDVELHFTDKLEKVYAYVAQDSKNPLKYNVYLSRSRAQLKVNGGDHQLTGLIDLFIDAGHEFNHIVQFLNTPQNILKKINKLDKAYSLYDTTPIKSKKEEKLVNKLIANHIDDINVSHSVELESDAMSYELFTWIMQDILEFNEDAGYKQFISNIIRYVQDSQKCRILDQKFCKTRHNQIKNIFKERYNIDIIK